MEDSILRAIRELLVGNSEDTSFDMDLIFAINAALSNLTQIGVGPKEGFRITGEDETWDDLLADEILLEQVKEYVQLRVRIIFDPPSSSAVVDAYNKEIAEREWRINITVDDQTGRGKEGE